MAVFTCTAKLDSGAHGARCAWAKAVHHAVGISRQRNSGYRPSRVNIVAQGLSTSDPSLSPTHLSIRRGRTTTTYYTHHEVSLMVSHNTTLVPSLGLHIGPACEAGLSTDMRREHVPPWIGKKRKKEEDNCRQINYCTKLCIAQSMMSQDVRLSEGRYSVETALLNVSSNLLQQHFGVETPEWCGWPADVKQIWGQNTGMWQTDRQTDRPMDRWTSCDNIVHAKHNIAQ